MLLLLQGVFQLLVDSKGLKTEDRISLCETFIHAGYPIKENIQLPQILSRKPHMDPEFVKYVQNQQSEVLTLKSICRICVRNNLIKMTRGYSIKRKIFELPLPKLLQKYVDFDR